MLGKHFAEAVAPLSVVDSHASEMSFEVAVPKQLREGDLFARSRLHVFETTKGCDRLDECRWNDHPTKPQSRGECLAGGSEIDHAVGIERLQGTDGRAVVTQLGVVVVLDDERGVGACPGDCRCAAFGS
jgi:hypothetical protein